MSIDTFPSSSQSEASLDDDILPERRPKYVAQYEVNRGEAVSLSTDTYMASPEEMYSSSGLALPLVGGVSAGGKQFAIVLDSHNEYFTKPLIVIDDDFNFSNNNTEFKGLNHGEVAIFGRKNNDRFTYPETVSSEHFSVEYDEIGGQVLVRDLNSTNGTNVSGYTHDLIPEPRRVVAEFTSNFINDAALNLGGGYGDQESEAPYGYFKNHPIIGRESPSVRDGIYATSTSECVVVDDKSRAVKEVTDEYFKRLTGDGLAATVSVHAILRMAESYTAQVLNYDLEKVKEISEPHYYNQGLIYLSDYINAGVGVCRHQALLSAHLIEEAIQRKMISGTVGVERNHDLEIQGAHAWAIYRPNNGDTIVIDPAQHFVGTRAQAERQGRWKYQLSNVDTSP